MHMSIYIYHFNTIELILFLQRMELANRKRLLLRQCVAAAAMIVCTAAFFILDDDEDYYMTKKQRKEEMPFMMNNKLYSVIGTPTQPLMNRVNLFSLLRDPNRNYCKVFTSLYGWELIALATFLKPFIEVSRNDITIPMGNRIKFDYLHRTYFILYWLVSGAEMRQMEVLYGWSKSSIQLELNHMLNGIIRGLDLFVQWPSVEERQSMADRHTGLFKNCVGIIDASEHPIEKYKNEGEEQSTYSGKQQCNTIKTLAVIDQRGRFRFVLTGTSGILTYTYMHIYLKIEYIFL